MNNILLLLVEAQSTWSVNISARAFVYLANSVNDYKKEHDLIQRRGKELETIMFTLFDQEEAVQVAMRNQGRRERAEGRTEGREEGAYNHAKSTALSMAKDNLPIDMIAKYVSYSTDVIRSWIAAAE